jgi:sulfur-carrier protein adenylyltransferase/sulfurtransferase
MKLMFCLFAVAFFCCSSNAQSKIILQLNSSVLQQGVPTISAADLKARLAKSTSRNIILLDVREPDEHAERHISNSLLIPLGELPQRIGELDAFKDKEIIIYCRSGRRSAQACEILMKQNFRVKNLEGGILAW